jgi:hypothetical protein
VLRSRPVRRAISLIDTPPTKCMRRISAHCSTSTNDLLLARPHQQTTRLHPRPDTDAPTAQGVNFQPARRDEYSGGADRIGRLKTAIRTRVPEMRHRVQAVSVKERTAPTSEC